MDIRLYKGTSGEWEDRNSDDLLPALADISQEALVYWDRDVQDLPERSPDSIYHIRYTSYSRAIIEIIWRSPYHLLRFYDEPFFTGWLWVQRENIVTPEWNALWLKMRNL